MADEKTGTKDIVIIGASYGGNAIAHHLLRHTLPVLPAVNVRVVLISTSNEGYCRPAGPRAMLTDDAFDQSKLFTDLPTAFAHYPKSAFQFVHGLVTRVDHKARTVTVKGKDNRQQTLAYYSLVVASGSNTSSPLFGLNQDNAQLKSDWKVFRDALPKAKHIVIVGGGPTGVETAGELADHLNGKSGGWFCSTPSTTDKKAEITLVTSAAHLLPILRPAIADKADSQLSKLGVKVIKSKRVTAVEPADAGTSTNLTSPARVTLDDGSTLDADLYIPATGVKPNTSFLDKSLLEEDGSLRTNAQTLRVDEAGPRVYCIGDAGSYSANKSIPVIFSAVPVLGANMKRDMLLDLGDPASESTRTSAAAAAAAAANKEDRIWKEDQRTTQLVPIGKSGGVGAAFGWQLPKLMVWAIKGRDYFLSHTPAMWTGAQFSKEG